MNRSPIGVGVEALNAAHKENEKEHGSEILNVGTSVGQNMVTRVCIIGSSEWLQI